MRKYFFSSLLISLIIISVAYSQTVETVTIPFNASGGVSIDDSGTVYVADFGNFLNFANGTKVYKVFDDGSGTIQQFATGLFGASGNDFDSQGNLYQSNISSQGGNKLSKITPDGTVTTFATSGILGPVGVAVAEGDIIYVANCGGNSIAKVLPNGSSSVWVSDSRFQCPNGLTIDDDGNLYTCNFGSGDIIKITPDKQVSILATVPGGRCGHLTYFEGFLYVVARCAHKIYRVTLDGDTTLIAGSGVRGNNDGPGQLASFNHPNGIEAIRVGGNTLLYVNDATSLTGDCTTVPLNPVVLRKITIPDSVVSINEANNQVPSEFKLYQNYPNPFNPTTKIKFTIPETNSGDPKLTSLKVYDILGNLVRTLIREQKYPGEYEVTFDAQNLVAGIYTYVLKINQEFMVNKMVLLK